MRSLRQVHYDPPRGTGHVYQVTFDQEILSHAGVRLIGESRPNLYWSIMNLLTEPELFRGYDPKKKVFNQEIELVHDLEAIEVAQSEAEKFKYEHGDKCDIWTGEGDQWFVKFKMGACVFVPKAFKLSRLVAGQIPI
jgi:fatty acid synthase subunit alpha